MQFNNNLTMKDLFMNKELKNIFPQFSERDKLQNVYSFEFVEHKVREYIKNVFNGSYYKGNILVYSKFKLVLKTLKDIKGIIEDTWNNISSITKNIRRNTRVYTPFSCIDEIKSIGTIDGKIMAMQIVLNNLNYNPECASQNRFSSTYFQSDYLFRQAMWMKAVGYKDK